MAYLQTTCVIGTLAISASNSCALGSIVISDTMSPGPEFNGNCNLIAIGQNTTLTGSLGLMQVIAIIKEALWVVQNPLFLQEVVRVLELLLKATQEDIPIIMREYLLGVLVQQK